MASIYKRPKSKKWQCQFYITDTETGDMAKVRQSTGCTNKKLAQQFADEQERNHKAVMVAGSDRAMRAKFLLAEAVAEIERETFTAPTARKYISKLLALASPGEVLESYTLETWSAEWIRRKERDKSSKATMARYKSHRDALLQWLGTRSKRPLEALTSQEARQWREYLQDGGRAGKTVLSYTKDAGAIYRAAIREGLVSFNPFASLEAIDTSDSQERKPFTGEEVAKLIKAAPTEQWRGLVLVAAYTGLRLGDAARLSWEAVDLEAKRITLIPSKTARKKREVRIPIQEDLLAYLLAAPVAEDNPAAPVFPSLATLKIGDRAGLSQAFAKIMAKAGVDRGKPSRIVKEGEATKGRITWERGFHSLRHTFTTWLRGCGVSEEDRMALTGHTTRDSHAIYSHADETALRDAIAKLPSLTSKKSKP